MQLSRQEISNLHAALAGLGGRQVETKDGDKTVVIVKPYDITGTARYAVAKTRRALKATIEAIDAEREALWAKHGGEPGGKLEGTAAAAFQRDFAEYLKGTETIEPHRFPVADLKIGPNQLDPTLIEALLPILIDEG